jgi:hypothetical protein
VGIVRRVVFARVVTELRNRGVSAPRPQEIGRPTPHQPPRPTTGQPPAASARPAPAYASCASSEPPPAPDGAIGTLITGGPISGGHVTVNGTLQGLPVLAEQADAAWGAALAELDRHLPDEFRRFRRLYPLIYRNGSRFTHPTTHVAARFISGIAPRLTVGLEQPLERDLARIATGILTLALGVATVATPALGLTLEEVGAALDA